MVGLADDLDGGAAGGGVHAEGVGGLLFEMKEGFQSWVVGIQPMKAAGEEVEEFGEGSAGFGDEFDEADEIGCGEDAEVTLLESHPVFGDGHVVKGVPV